ncbi:MAG: FecR domain-containing protein [Pseudomonadota bacterium]
MSSLDPQTMPEQHILQQAAEWFATLSGDEVSDQDRAAWQRWFSSHTDHQLAWQYVERVGLRFSQAQGQAGSDEASRILKATRNERIHRRNLLGGSMAAIAGVMLWRYTPLSDYSQHLATALTADYKTATGETQELALADGGQLWLNTASAMNVHYTEHLRNIELHHGELLVQTAADSQQRPFVVTTTQGTLRALGTRFGVQNMHETSLLSVYEGAVEIITQSGNTATLRAGQSAHFSVTEIQQPGPVSDARQSWARGMVVAKSIPLKELVEELGRYRHGYLAVNPAVADLSVIGIYPTDNIDQALAMLEDALPIKIKRALPWWVTLEPE